MQYSCGSACYSSGARRSLECQNGLRVMYNSVMSDSPTAVAAVAFTESRTHEPVSERRKRWFEVCLVVSVSCGSYIVNSFYLLANGPGAAQHISNVRWTAGLVQEITALLLLGYVLSRRGLTFKNLGF